MPALNEALVTLWAASQATLAKKMQKVTDEAAPRRIAPAAPRAVFLLLHIAEAQLAIADMFFETQSGVAPATFFKVDEGQAIEVAEAHKLLAHSTELITNAISALAPDQWEEIKATPFGEISRLRGLGVLMDHTAHHAGQVAQAVKYGTV